MKIYVEYRPCCCDAIPERHYHINDTDVMTWKDFKKGIEKLEEKNMRAAFTAAISDVKGDPKEKVLVQLGDIPDSLLKVAIDYNEKAFMKEITRSFGMYLPGISVGSEEPGPVAEMREDDECPHCRVGVIKWRGMGVYVCEHCKRFFKHSEPKTGTT
jgi:ribosomal protein L37AE/L43A